MPCETRSFCVPQNEKAKPKPCPYAKLSSTLGNLFIVQFEGGIALVVGALTETCHDVEGKRVEAPCSGKPVGGFVRRRSFYGGSPVAGSFSSSSRFTR